jgi:hypothetical protein
MDNYLKAYAMGQAQARNNFVKTGSAATDIAAILGGAGQAGSSLMSGLKSLASGGAKGASKTLRTSKGLATLADPRIALLLGLGAAGTATTGNILAEAFAAPAVAGATKEILPTLLKGLAAPAIAGGGMALAAAANPGLFGGSVPNRIAHEIAMSSRTPAGLVGAMAGLVGLPAALIGYGKMKGKEEASLFG